MKTENKDIKVADIVTEKKKEDISENELNLRHEGGPACGESPDVLNYTIKPKEQIFYWDDELDDCFEKEM